VLAGLAPDATRLEASVERARKALREIPGIKLLYKQDSFVLPTEREHFGFKDGISHPAVEGSGIPGSNPQERPLKAGEFVLGYPDEGDRCLSCLRRKCSAATAPILFFASSASAWRHFASICAPTPRARKLRNCSRRSSLDAGAAGVLWRSRPSAMTRRVDCRDSRSSSLRGAVSTASCRDFGP